MAGPNASFTATVDELAGEEEATSYVMACSCATNVAGESQIQLRSIEPRSRCTCLLEKHVFGILGQVNRCRNVKLKLFAKVFIK